MSRSTMQAAPSPNGTNKERLFVRSVLVNRRDMLALDDAYGGGTGNRRRPMSKLHRALKMRFGTPQRAMAALGLDASLLKDGGVDHTVGEPHPRHPSWARGLDEEEETAEEAEHVLLRRNDMSDADIQSLIDGHTAKSDLDEREGEDDDPPIVHPSPRKNEGDHRRVSYDDFKNYLTERGFSEDEIADAMIHARDHVRRRADDKRRRVGRDVLPKNASGTNAHGGGMGGHISGSRTDKARDEIDQIHRLSERFGPNAGIATGPDSTRFSRDDIGHEVREQRELASGKLVDHGIDSARRRGARDVGGEEVGKIHELLKRFGSGEAGAAPDRHRGAMDSKRTRAPSEADKARFHKMFPNASLIGSVSEDGVGRRDPGHKNPYEVV